MSFRLVPKSVTLNDLERRNSLISRYFTEFSSSRGALHYIFIVIMFSSKTSITLQQLNTIEKI